MEQTFPVAAAGTEPLSLSGDGCPGRAHSFRKGDEVVLTGGPYWGTPGIFLRLRTDVKWADLEERNGSIRSHPVAWISRSTTAPGIESAGRMKMNSLPARSIPAWEDDGGALRPLSRAAGKG